MQGRLLSTRLRGVYVAGGHGPVAGLLLAAQSTTGEQPEALREFDPLRRTGGQTCAASRSTPP
jgi:D-amino-acid dehydrogenase